MREELLQAKGRLNELRHRKRELELEASGLILLVRIKLDPYADISSLPIPEARQSMERLAAIHDELKEVLSQIQRIEADLGELA